MSASAGPSAPRCGFSWGSSFPNGRTRRFPSGRFSSICPAALLLGILFALNTGQQVTLFLGEGFLGAFTTFSTFMYEGLQLFQENEKGHALLYLGGTLILGLVGFAVGFVIGTAFTIH
jgi:CrcB protein